MWPLLLESITEYQTRFIKAEERVELAHIKLEDTYRSQMVMLKDLNDIVIKCVYANNESLAEFSRQQKLHTASIERALDRIDRLKEDIK